VARRSEDEEARGGRVGRGGLKLEAAVARFKLASRIRGARAIDIGASTGGFTAALLEHGAAHVTAVDVGKGQLPPSLREDKRVENLEGVHWKTLALTTAPGPYDFFTVDVSFIAARNMLRGLAFRLRPGAEGVLLVKPQFEVADKRVKAGDVSDPNLRREAVDVVKQKAESLGFTLVAQADSPVAGGSGTVEILAHLRFEGRSAKMPQPGESRGHKEPKKKHKARGKRADGAPQIASSATELAMFAVAAPGVEAVLAREVSSLPGVRAVKPLAGGVEFGGDVEVMMRANLWLRTATRVLVRVGSFEAREFSKMRHRAAALPWERFVDPARAVALSASQSGSRLYHTGAITENLQAALTDRLGGDVAIGSDGQKVLVRGVADQWTLSVDSSGELLHRRGWRQETALAPLRETLAAALLLLSGWDPATALADPMCGAGTLPLEACAIAMRIAPGLDRRFAFEAWPGFDAALWARVRQEAKAAQLPAPPAPIVGSDRSPAAVSAAQHNAERAGLAAHVKLVQAELDDLAPPPGPGTVIMNPPYGRRLGDPRALRSLYGTIGRALRAHFAGWHAALLVADMRLLEAVGVRVVADHPLINGGLRVHLVELDLGRMKT
jgi:putative N6-adenine-specific DNA methylase